MGTMPWADDTRCLFCDGKLPLYRKLTQGQFCSKAHQAAYWQEQERLAVERLHQTHDAIRAYRPPEPIENILGPSVPPPAGFEEPDPLEALLNPAYKPTPAPASAGQDSVPGLFGLMAQTLPPSLAELPDLVAADPFEYEMVFQPWTPIRDPKVIEMRPLAQAGAVPTWDGFQARGAVLGFEAALAEPTERTLVPRHPEHSAVFLFSVPEAGRIALPVNIGPVAISNAHPRGELQAVTPVIEPVNRLVLEVAPESDVLERLLFDQLKLAETLRRLPLVSAQGAGYGLSRTVRVKRLVFKIDARRPRLVAAAGSIGETWAPVASGLRALNTSARLAGVPLSTAATRVSEPEPMPSEAAESAPVRPTEIALPAPAAALEPNTAGLRALVMATAAAPGVQRIQPATAEPENLSRSAPVAKPTFAPQAHVDFALRTKAEGLHALPYRKWTHAVNAPLNLRTVNASTAQALPSEPILPESRLEPLADKPIADMFRRGRYRLPLVHPAALLQPAADFWRNAPRDLKMLLFAIPLLIAVVFHPSLPKVAVSAPESSPAIPGEVKQVLNTQFANLKQSVLNRAAIALDEDFRQGLDEWTSRGGATAEWSFDATGFVRPGPLALYKPSMGLTDYQMQFLGMIDNRALSWVVRAVDFQNYYVVRLVMVRPGPLPQIVLQRYAVIDGQAVDRVDTPVPISAREQMQYRVRLDVHGDDFSVAVQGQMVDAWTETRLERGGIGFFTLRGEQSRVRWVQLTHQYDVLGRLCAYLAPYDISTTTGSW